MTLERLQKDMLEALRNGDKVRKNTLSMIISRIKNAAIDQGIRDAIDEKLVDTEILKYQKIMKESVESYHTLTPQWEQACEELAIVGEYAPHLIDSPYEIKQVLVKEYSGPMTKKDMMKFLSANYRGKMDMKIASSVVDTIIGG